MSEKPALLVLDDDPSRHAIFAAAVGEYEVVQTYQLATFKEAIVQRERLALVALDHDLGGGVNANRPLNECGCDAAELVARCVSTDVPVLIHSANMACAQAMRVILIRARHRGRVSRMNFNTVMKGDERAGIEIIRGAVHELVKKPLWPEDLDPEDLIEMLGDNPDAICPVRAGRDP